ncbi:MAG: site-specific tyrosine recombinase/integron integrase [Desulfitobacterium sp.]
MLTPTLSTTAELMLEEVMGANFASDRQVLRDNLTHIFSKYDIKPAQPTMGHPDLQQKIELFLAGKRLEGLSELTLKGYAIELRVFSEDTHKATDEITTADLRIYLGSFKNLKPTSISGKLSVLKSFFCWLTSEDILPKDPSRRIKPPKKEKRLPKALTIEELEMLRESCSTPRERALIEVMYATGCRLSEVQAMDKEDIDHQTMSAKVIGKGNKERVVYFSYKAMYHLKKYLMRRTDDVEALFITERQPYRRLSARGIQREIGIIAGRSGIKKNVHPHVLRHTFATLMLNNGADIASVQALLGHDDPGTTQIYAQATDERKQQAYRQHLVQ